MLSKKLLSLLDTFSKNELSRFRKYLISPFFNENELLIKLFNLIELNQKYPEIRNGLDKELVWQKLYEGKKFDDPTLRRLCSALTKMAYQFLLYEQSKANPVQEQTQLLEILNQRKLDKHFQSLARKLEDQQSKSEWRNVSFHFNRYRIEKYRHLSYEQSMEKIDTFENLQKSDYHLECFYIIQKLKHYCDSLGYKIFMATEAEIILPEGFIQYLENNRFLEEPSIKAYYLVMQLLLDRQNETNYFQLKDFLKSNIQLFSKPELNTLYIHLNNYCIQEKINMGKSEYFVELFDNFKTQIEAGIIFKNGELVPQDYKNIITVGLHLKELNWVEKFIQNYTKRLPKENQENALTYNLANVYLIQKKYHKVIEQLREVEYQNLIYALGSKLMLIKTYYELNEILALDSLIDSFRIYLRRNKMISKEVKQKYLNVLRFVKKLTNLAPYDKAGIEKVKKQINDCKALADKKWILEKTEEIERAVGKLTS